MKKRVLGIIALISVLALSGLILFGCSKQDDAWKTYPEKYGYDYTLPDLSGLPNFDETVAATSTANDAGWFVTLWDNFDGAELNQSTVAYNDDGTAIDVQANPVWTYSPHDYRTQNEKSPEKTSYWCPSMVSFRDGTVVIGAEQRSDHVCPNGTCPASGRFTGGIETRQRKDDTPGADTKGNNDIMLFSQAFGYFEARVKFPNAAGLWSAFWLQSSNQRNVANAGVDGTEIDIYESAFYKNKTKMGNALLWNGYGNAFSDVSGYIGDTGTDLYDGFHTFSLKWTPEYYVFYIDNQLAWASNAGGVSKVKEFLRLTVEIDEGDGWGPHAQKIGQFKDNTSEFIIDYVRVYQNKNYLKHVLDDTVFAGSLDMSN